MHNFLEYQPGKCFKKYHDVLYQLRVNATIEGNSAKATAVKLTGNSSYGKVCYLFILNTLNYVQTIQNPLNFMKNTFCNRRAFDIKQMKPTFRDHIKLTETMIEVKEIHTKIKERYPIHVGNTILHLSKLLLCEFVCFLEKYLLEGEFELCYGGKTLIFVKYSKFLKLLKIRTRSVWS